MRCPTCESENDEAAEACFTCGRAFDVLTRGVVLSGRYEVRRPVGAGGMGRVYEAFDRVLEEPVAIKVLRAELTRDPELARRFLSEIKLARKVSHRNVGRIHEYNEDAGVAFISMEYIEGPSLKALLLARRPAYPEAFDLALQVAEGLAAIHEHGIVHRDFKSGNIMVDGRGVAKILDFGIAKRVGENTTSLTGGGHVFGTPEYMSPEQVEGQKVDSRSDIYALGCVVYEIFTGRPPFIGETPYATLLKHIQEPPQLDPAVLGLPARLLATLSQALAKHPARRHASATAFITALLLAREDALGATNPAPPAPPPAPVPQPVRDRFSSRSLNTVTLLQLRALRARKGRVAWVAGAVVAVALAVGVSLQGGVSPRASESRDTSGGQVPPPVLPTPVPSLAPASPPAAAVPTTLTTPTATARAAVEGALPTATPRPSPPSTTPSRAQSGPAPVPTTLAAAPVPVPVADTGTLTLILVPEAAVVLDDEAIGVVSRRDITLRAGPHALRILHPDYEPLPRRFTIRAGETLSLLLDLQEKGIPKTPPKKSR